MHVSHRARSKDDRENSLGTCMSEVGDGVRPLKQKLTKFVTFLFSFLMKVWLDISCELSGSR